MFQTWGRFRSFANAHLNGGFQMTGAPGPAPIGRHEHDQREQREHDDRPPAPPSERSPPDRRAIRLDDGRRHVD
jgi:hypothetical protein